jgi:hypothetical protein
VAECRKLRTAFNGVTTRIGFDSCVVHARLVVVVLLFVV